VTLKTYLSVFLVAYALMLLLLLIKATKERMYPDEFLLCAALLMCAAALLTAFLAVIMFIITQ
jgi:hypothetical protein